MTAGASALAAGFSSLLGVHGETLTRRSAADVQTTEWGEAVTDENQGAVVIGNESTSTFTGIFVEDYETFSGGNAGYSTTETVVMARTDDVSGFARGDVITRSEVDYYVTEISPDNQGMTTLTISKDAH